MFRKTPSKGREFKGEKSTQAIVNLEVPLVSTTKQKRGWLNQNKKERRIVYERAGYTQDGLAEGRVLPQVNGGGPIETGGDGTGRAGGVDLNYWGHWLKHFAEWKRMANLPNPVEGHDYPSKEQMELARRFYAQRESF